MRVGLVCPYSLSVPGGVQGQVLGLGQALRRRGIEARILGPCDGPPPDAFVTPLGESIHTASNGSMAAVAPDPAASLRTIRALRDEAFNVVHIHEPLAPGPTLTALVFSDAPLVGTFHRSGESSWYRKVRPLARWAATRLDIRAAVSDQARATAVEALGGSYDMVWNGIDVEAYRRIEKPEPDVPTVLFVGRHEPRKGLEVLLRAFELLPAGTRLWVCGEGPQTTELRRRTRGIRDVEWLGSIDEAEKMRRLKAASVLCAPSTHGESFGIVLLEAMAAGLPVVASDLAGYRTVVRDGVEAVLVPPSDHDALAKALTRVLAGAPGVDAMTAAAVERAGTFSLDRLAARYLEMYESARAAHG